MTELKNFWDFNIGNLLSFAVYAAMFAGFIYTMRGRVDNLDGRMASFESEMKKLVEVLVVQGRQEERVVALQQQVIAQGRRLDELYDRCILSRPIDRK